MWLIMGTSPQLPEAELIYGEYSVEGANVIGANGHVLHLERGVETLATAASLVCKHKGVDLPHLLCAGDKGKGDGSSKLYDYLAQNLRELKPQGITFHYLFPDVDGHNKVLMAIEDYALNYQRPTLVADAGFMYVAKMSGYADYYDLFTPDMGEMAFLADEKAPHPFYTRGFLLDNTDSAEELLSRAYEHGNVAKNLIIKGSTDYVVQANNILAKINSPSVPSMEAIGGTGDLVTGITTGLLAAGFTISDASLIAVKTNRVLAKLAKPSPATQVHELTPYLCAALEEVLRKC